MRSKLWNTKEMLVRHKPIAMYGLHLNIYSGLGVFSSAVFGQIPVDDALRALVDLREEAESPSARSTIRRMIENLEKIRVASSFEERLKKILRKHSIVVDPRIVVYPDGRAMCRIDDY